MKIIVDNGGFNSDYCYMKSYTRSESKNQDSIEYTKKRDEISTNICLLENNRLPDGIGIDYMLPAYALYQYVNMEYNNWHHNLQIDSNISTSNNSSVSTLTSPFITSTNDKGFS